MKKCVECKVNDARYVNSNLCENCWAEMLNEKLREEEENEK